MGKLIATKLNKSMKNILQNLSLKSKFFFLLIFLSTYAIFPGLTKNLFADWENLSQGMETKKISLTGAFFSPELLLLKADLKQFTVKVVQSSSFELKNSNVRELSLKSGALLGINASFFDEKGKAIGLIVNKGRTEQKIHKGGNTLTGIFAKYENTYKIVHKSKFILEGALEAIQSGPRLVSQGKAIKGVSLGIPKRRAGLCLLKENKIIFYVSSSFTGVSLKDMQGILINEGCKTALNLDGGGSAQLYIAQNENAGHPEINIYGRDNIPVILGLFKK